MRNRLVAVTLAALVITLAGSSSRSSQSSGHFKEAAPTAHVEQPTRTKRLTIDPSLPAHQIWIEEDGQRRDVVPATAYTVGKVARPIRATTAGSLTGEVEVVLDHLAWRAPGEGNASAPVVKVIGIAGKPQNWERLPVPITPAIVKNPDGSERRVPTDGWLVDAGDETNGLRCSLEQPDFSQGEAEPTVQTPAGQAVAIFLSKDILL